MMPLLARIGPSVQNVCGQGLSCEKKKTLVIVSDDTRPSKLLYGLIHPIAKG